MKRNESQGHTIAEDYQILDKPIPLDSGVVTGWKEMPIILNNEPLVPLGIGTNFHNIYTSAIYAGERKDSPYINSPYKGSLITAFVRRDVAERLSQAQSMLPQNHHLVIFDAYRPLEVQHEIYNQYFQKLKTLHSNWSEEQLSAETQKYASLPSSDDKKPSPHYTGGSVDLAIVKVPSDIDIKIQAINNSLSLSPNDSEKWLLTAKKTYLIAKHGQMLEFGTPYDYGGKEASLTYYENLALIKRLSKQEQKALLNRRMLYNLMTFVGLEGYADEWWHFNSRKTQMGSVTAGYSYAEYSGIDLQPVDYIHEENRRKHMSSGSGRAIRQSSEYPIFTTETTIKRAAVLVPPKESFLRRLFRRS